MSACHPDGEAQTMGVRFPSDEMGLMWRVWSSYGWQLPVQEDGFVRAEPGLWRNGRKYLNQENPTVLCTLSRKA